MAYLPYSIDALHILCHKLLESYTSGWTQQLATTGRDEMFSTVMDMFYVYCRLFLTSLGYNLIPCFNLFWLQKVYFLFRLSPVFTLL
jgi:hypothetical protein